MPMEIRCTHCSSTFRVPTTAAGKRTKCPKCKQLFTVAPQAAASAPSSTPAITPGAPTVIAQWHVKSPDGEQYGPISKSDLDQWVAENRIDAKWQLLRQGDGHWQWASDVYSHLQRDEELPPAISIDAAASVPSNAGGSVRVDTDTSGGKYRPPFRARQYPAMRFVSYFFYGLAALTGLSLLISLGGIAMMMAGGGAMSVAGPDEVGATLGGMVMLMGVIYAMLSIIGHGSMIAAFVYAAESVRIIIDIQQNTQETAYYTKYAAV